MIPVPASAPQWWVQVSKTIEQLIDEVRPVNRVKVFPLATLPAAADHWRTKTGYQESGFIAVQATAGVTLCISDGTNWIDLQTGSAVA